MEASLLVVTSKVRLPPSSSTVAVEAVPSVTTPTALPRTVLGLSTPATFPSAVSSRVTVFPMRKREALSTAVDRTSNSLSKAVMEVG